MRKSSGRQIWNASMPFMTRYTRPNIRWGKNLGQRIWARPTHGRVNIQYVQPKDEQIFNTSNPRTNKYSIRPTHGQENAYELKLVKNTRPDHGRGNEEYINTKTIQHMDEAKVVIKNYKFKDVMKNHYSIMFFRRRVKTDECFLIKITPMDEHELIF